MIVNEEAEQLYRLEKWKKLKCIKCGLNKRGNTDFYICNPCNEFSKLVDIIYTNIEENLTTMRTIDPDTTPIFRLLADSSFITAQNPQTRIFYKLCEFFVENAIEEKLNIYTTIHLDPVIPPSALSIKIESIINNFIKDDKRIDSFHDLRLIGEEDYSNLLFDLVIKRDLKSAEKVEMKNSLVDRIKKVVPVVKDIQIKYERSYL